MRACVRDDGTAEAMFARVGVRVVFMLLALSAKMKKPRAQHKNDASA